MWIAKNSITGTFYGKKFNNIMDCQHFIDTELLILEYEMQRCFSLEKEIISKIEFNSKHKDEGLFQRIMSQIKEGIDEFAEESGLIESAKVVAEFSFKGKTQKEIDTELHKLACARWQRNNIIRCWHVVQKRFADGFDF